MLARLARLSRPAAAAVKKIITWKMVSYGWAWPGEASEIAMPAATSRQAIQRQTGPRRSMIGVERDRRPERERREPEPDLVVGDARGPDDQADPDGPGPAPGEREALGGDERQGQPQRVQLGPVRQQRDHVDRGQRHAESQVLDQLLAPRRERGQPRRQRLREPGQPRRHRLHDPMVRRGARRGDHPEGGSGCCDPGWSRGRSQAVLCDAAPSREFALAPDAPGWPASSP